MKPTLLSILIVMCVVCTASAVYKYEFTGFVYDLGEKSEHDIDISCYQEFTGWFSFSPIPNQSSINDRGDYDQRASIFVDFGNYQMAYIYNNIDISTYNGNDYDKFSFRADGYQGLYKYNDFDLTFEDQTGTAFDTADLPETLNFLDFDYIGLHLDGYNRFHSDNSNDWWNFDFYGVITDLTKINEVTPTPTPEPATIALMGLGFIALRTAKRKK